MIEVISTEAGELRLVAITGILAFLAFLFTAFVGYTNHHGKKFLAFKWHPKLAIISFIFAVLHAIFAFSLFL